MNRDPLYRQVEDSLPRLTDGNLFEECATALLGKAYPNLAPMPGGNDAGMDGAFGTPEGPFPLVCTIESDVIGNFRTNISTYLAKRNGPKRAVVATSQALSNTRKRNIEDAAAELGVTLVNIHDAPYFVNALYRDSKWRLELLGISGDPPALSALPRSGRFAEAETLIGRAEELAWLREVQGDALLVGQPGSGKTYLHQYLAKENLCLFAVDDSLGRLADAIRDQQPSIIVVDDAQINLPLVENLDRLRAELGATYHIHLNCWPHYEERVQRILRIPNNRVRRLPLLRKREIYEIITQAGVKGPDWLQELIISQSDGKPGLAFALAELCKTQGVAEVWSGEAMARQLLGDLRLIRDAKERCVLAAFAVGGDFGMSFDQVSDAIGLPKLELYQITTALGSGGVVEHVAEDRLQVRPPAIRPVLVREIFFREVAPMSIDSLLAGEFSAASTVTVLLDARQRGANVNCNLLEALVTAADTRDVWEHFAWVDGQCADLILDKYSSKVCDAAPGLLIHSPSRALPALLDADDANLVHQAGAVEHPRRSISKWLFSIDDAPEATVQRRLMLLDVLEDRVRQNKIGDGSSIAWALAEILQASFDVTKQTPDGSGIRFRRGVVSRDILAQIAALWPRVKDLFRHVPNAIAHSFLSQLETWCLPQRLSFAAPLSEETCEMVRQQGRQMLVDVLAMPHCNRAWRTWAARIARWAEFDLKIEVDALFDALYAERDDPQTWEQQERQRTAELHTTADDLLNHPMDFVLRYLADARSEAVEFGTQNVNGFLWVIYNRIAAKCEDPCAWLDALVARDAPSEFVIPFVDRLSQGSPGPYEAVLHRLLQHRNYQPLAISRSLRLPIPNEALLSSALALLNNADVAGHLGLRDSDIPSLVMARLLAHPNSDVRAAAAVGEWQREPVGIVHPELEAQWRVAVRNVNASHYALNDIFEKDPALACDWLQFQLQRGNCYLSMESHGVYSACKVLEKRQRAELLRLFTARNFSDELFDLLLGDNFDLFADWLEHQQDDYLRLLPLNRFVSPRWERMATVALDAGVSPEELAKHCIPTHWFGVGSLSQQFLEKIPAYEALANHADPRLRIVGSCGLAYMQSQAQSELERERREDTFGS